MSNTDRLPFSRRVSRYEPELRAGDPRYESWIDYGDIGETFNGFVLTSEEYLRVEGAYIATAVAFAVETSSTTLKALDVRFQGAGFRLSEGQTIVRSDIGPVVRGNLRGKLDCGLESTDGSYQLGFGYDLYMYVATRPPCEEAIASAWRSGVWLETDIEPPSWERDDD